MLLRAEQHLPQERVGQELVNYAVSSVEYNVAIADSIYAYTPPPQSTLFDTPGELKAALGRVLQP